MIGASRSTIKRRAEQAARPATPAQIGAASSQRVGAMPRARTCTKVRSTAARELAGRARNQDRGGQGWNAGDELRFQRRLERAARAGPKIPARALPLDGSAADSGRARALRQGAVE